MDWDFKGFDVANVEDPDLACRAVVGLYELLVGVGEVDGVDPFAMGFR